MKITLTQINEDDLRNNWNNNFDYIINTIKEKGNETDLIVFPELITCNYNLTKSELIENALDLKNNFFSIIMKLSTELDVAICLGFPEKSVKFIYNSSVIILPNGKYQVYRKLHLFGKEKKMFKPGNFELKNLYWDKFDINIGQMICYDWRFPEVARKLSLEGADLILCPSALVFDKWDSFLPCRSIENRVYIAVCNREGNDKDLYYTGKSNMFDPFGNSMIQNTEINSSLEFDQTLSSDKTLNEFNDLYEDIRCSFY